MNCRPAVPSHREVAYSIHCPNSVCACTCHCIVMCPLYRTDHRSHIECTSESVYFELRSYGLGTARSVHHSLPIHEPQSRPSSWSCKHRSGPHKIAYAKARPVSTWIRCSKRVAYLQAYNMWQRSVHQLRESCTAAGTP
ncbi:uncharacterized protein SCHCODRAFT_02022632 [Schizophyllum commune H4-8]|uniref:uncharacterized protein n=1 Tax=Schizophyllum commune (strain H4-8 / FGSC 9210) TaxID=578458 RepID=UPI002160B508|nr:uncharacterized protein SCHCODRAFT_02022632 [Schizophyllum commune H4-8]KAI5899873.1 hypothetical protein SCHCODRAFT_02022632 [Schizophyllum commune H4-8]